jgi:outer membrane protein insertion porin family
MNPFRLCGLLLLAVLLPSAQAQFSAPSLGKVSRIEIRHVGPAKVSDEYIRAHIRVKPGDDYLPAALDDDIHSLYATGFFYNIQVQRKEENGGLVLTYVVQEKPRLTDIKFQGNKKYSEAKLRKKLTTKTGEPLNETKLFTDTQEILKLYQKAGYPQTKVEYTFSIDPEVGRASATFIITETPKVRIIDVEFDGASAFTQKKLRKVVKTRRHWMFSWITGSGYIKDEVLEEDFEKLREFYRDNGFIDFEFREVHEGTNFYNGVQFINPSPNTVIVRFLITEGTKYKVGSVKFTGNKLFSQADIAKGMTFLHNFYRVRGKVGTNGLPMDVGDTFTPKGFTKNIEAVEDFYGFRGYIDVNSSSRNLIVRRVPNTERGTMDLEFIIDEGQRSYIEKVEIRGNTKTKDRVIRRELSVSPGEVFNMVNVKNSKLRLETLQYFEPGKIDARPEDTEPPITGRKNLVIGVEEKNTGSFSVGAAFSSVDQIYGFAEITQGNFDLFHPPNFTGGGQKFRLRIQLGTLRKDFTLTFEEPWFLGQKLRLLTELYHHEADYQSLESIYDETRTGATIGLERALFERQLRRDSFRGGIFYTIEDVGINLNSGFHDNILVPGVGVGGPGGDRGDNPPTIIPSNVPEAILQEVGHHLLNRFRGSLSLDTRGGGLLPNKGQHTEVSGELVVGDHDYYRLRMSSGWYFRGFMNGHVIELVGRAGTAETLDGAGTDVPFYDRYYLGGLYDLRGYHYRAVSPREPLFPGEPIGGDTFWFGSLEYSVPIFEQDKEKGIGVRFAVFYDIGEVYAQPWTINGTYTDNWGFGLRLNLPIGPLRLDYGIPITHDKFSGSSGRFQFGVGYTREF